MKLKKVILGTTAVALTAAVSIGATLAYLTDTDEDVNVMTLGNVYIDQIEQERVDQEGNQNTLVDFEQNKPLLPAVYPGSEIPMAPADQWVVPKDEAWSVLEDNKNVVDKFVTVENTGKSDAYIRTIFAFEQDDNLIHLVKNEGSWVWEMDVATIELDGRPYSIAVATYTEPVAPGKTTIPSLKQVYMDKTATNEYCAQFGETYDILVFSQAIQTNGFKSADEALDAGFGVISDTNNPWTNKETNYTPDASEGTVQATLAEGGKVTLSSDVTVTDDSAAAKNVITKDTTVNFGGNTLTLDLPNADATTENWIGVEILGGNVVFEGGNGGITTSPKSDLFCSYVRNGATLTINGGKYIAGGSAVQVREGTLVVNGGYFAVDNKDNADGTADVRYVLNCTDANYKAGTANIIVKGGSFLNWNPANNAAEGAGTNFVADGYTVVEEVVADGILYTVVPA